MNIEFATCDRSRALEYLRRVYPSSIIADIPESAGALLDLVEADIVRIQDPMMYGASIAVSPGKNWSEEKRAEATRIASAFHESTK